MREQHDGDHRDEQNQRAGENFSFVLAENRGDSGVVGSNDVPARFRKVGMLGAGLAVEKECVKNHRQGHDGDSLRGVICTIGADDSWNGEGGGDEYDERR